MEFYQCTGASCDPSVFTAITANHNNIAGNTIGVRSNASYLTANGENNWWGAANGPATVGSGSGAQVSTFVDFAPWLNAPVAAVLSVPADPIVLQRTAPKIINVPVHLSPLAGDAISSVAFSIDYDQACLSTTAAKVTGLPAGFQVLALVGVTQQVLPGRSTQVSIEAMIEAADLAAPRMATVLVGIVAAARDR